MKKIVIAGLLFALGTVGSWAQVLSAPELQNNPALYAALTAQRADDVAKGPVVVYVWKGECPVCNNTLSELGEAGVFNWMKQHNVKLYTINLDDDKRQDRTYTGFCNMHRLTAAPVFVFFKDGVRKKRLGATSLTPNEVTNAVKSIL